MTRLPMAGAICAAALSGMLLPALHGQVPSQPAGSKPAAGTLDRRHDRAGKGRRARVGVAGEGDDESRHPAAALQPREGTAPPGQADHQLHHLQFRPGAVLRGRQAFRLHLVRDAAQHDVVRRGPAHDPRVPWRRRRADGAHARRARVEHSEGHRSRRPGHHRADGGRRARGAGCGAVLALSAVRAPQRRRRRLARAVPGRN